MKMKRPEDNGKLDRISYTCFSTDVIHEGHLNVINEARKYGRVIVGCLSDKASIITRMTWILIYIGMAPVVQIRSWNLHHLV